MSDPITKLITFIAETQFHQSGDDVVFNWPNMRDRVEALRGLDYHGALAQACAMLRELHQPDLAQVIERRVQMDRSVELEDGFRVKGAFFTVNGSEWHRVEDVVTVRDCDTYTSIVLDTVTLRTGTSLVGVLKGLS